MNKERKKLTINLYDEDVFNEYGVDGDEILQEELTTTISNLANTEKISTPLELTFIKPENNKIDNDKFVKAFSNSYNAEISRKKHECTRCIITGIILLLVGIAMLAFDVFVMEPLNYFFYEFFNVFAWVFCWGGIEILTIELIQLIMEKNKAKRVLNSKIVLVDKNKK
ncbi:MAG: hypothetical protein IKB42_01220 [Clostridia bacterium]|nr:hypothetical protein [Clostridia bacterium]